MPKHAPKQGTNRAPKMAAKSAPQPSADQRSRFSSDSQYFRSWWPQKKRLQKRRK
jgi:hypothetical protein